MRVRLATVGYSPVEFGVLGYGRARCVMDKGMDAKQTALFWLNKGVASIPLYFRSKIPTVKWLEFKSKLPTEDLIDSWYQEPRNIAIITGWQNLIVLDFDSVESYSCWFAWQLEHNPKILDTYRTLTSRGVHVYFYLFESIKPSSLQGALFECKAAGRLCTTPPSVHESGRAYTPLDSPENIRTVTPEQILNYSPVFLRYPARREAPPSKYAPLYGGDGESLINVIKESISILGFLPEAKQVDSQGEYWRGNCPFHGHKDNFWISKRLNVGGCYAGCFGGKALDVISFFAALYNCSVKQAIQELGRML